jgi:isoleucyl-tRNA synthetase
MREAGWVREPSVHVAGWPQTLGIWLDAQEQARWASVLAIRDVVMKALEEERARNVIGAPLEARVTLAVSDRALLAQCRAHAETLAEVCVVSQVAVEEAAQGGGTRVAGLTGVMVTRALGGKCSRCWRYREDLGVEATHPELCARCARVVMTMQTQNK